MQEAPNLDTRNAAWAGFDKKVRVESLLLAGAAYKPGQGKASMLLRALFKPRKI